MPGMSSHVQRPLATARTSEPGSACRAAPGHAGRSRVGSTTDRTSGRTTAVNPTGSPPQGANRVPGGHAGRARGRPAAALGPRPWRSGPFPPDSPRRPPAPYTQARPRANDLLESLCAPHSSCSPPASSIRSRAASCRRPRWPSPAGGRRLGDGREIRALADASTTVIDLKGAVVTPGLVDGHIHPVTGAEMTGGLDLSGCGAWRGCARPRRRVRKLAPGAWLRAWGKEPNTFGDAPGASASLSPVLDDVPALIQLFDAHSALDGPRALELAGVDGPGRDQAAEVVCDADGRPTGLLLEEAACELVGGPRPAQPAGERRASGRRPGLDGRRRAYRRPRHGRERDTSRSTQAWRAGACGCASRPGAGPAWTRMPYGAHRAGPGRFAVAHGGRQAVHGRHHRQRHRLAGAPRLPRRVHALLLARPRRLHPGDRRTARRRGAHRHARDRRRRRTPRPGRRRSGRTAEPDVRHRIEHIETVPDDTVARFAELGVVASMQPTHCAGTFTRADHTDNWSRRLGEERASHAWRCRDLYVGARVVLVWTGRSPTSRRWASWRRPATAVPAATSPSRRTAPARRSPPSKRSGA
ncbi:hypothetical protein SCALM49S_00550 [Streptomyces californicus]